MKNISILMTFLCALVAQLALTQSVLQLPTTKASSAQTDTIFIQLSTLVNEGIETASVEIVDGFGQVTFEELGSVNSNGDHELYVTDYGNYLNITPYLTLDPLNGVNTYDMILLRRHILGLENLNSPYKIIAADVNNSKSITMFDVFLMRLLILGVITDFPQLASWRFIDKNQVFLDPANPLAETLRESIEPLNMPKPYRADFIGIKMGDMDISATPNNFTNTEDRFTKTLLFEVEDRVVKAGEEIIVPFSGKSATEGYQFTLLTQGLSVMEVIPGNGLGLENFGTFKAENPELFSPVLTAAVETGATEFSIRFKAHVDGKLSKMLQIGHQITPAIAFDKSGDRQSVGLNFHETPLATEVFPNPWQPQTRIQFWMPADQQATLRMYDAQGKLLFQQSKMMEKGNQQWPIGGDIFSGAGVYFYELEAGSLVAKGKLVVNE